MGLKDYTEEMHKQDKRNQKSVIQTNYDIVKADGGEIKVETKSARAGSDGEGVGSEFIVELPLKK